MTPHRCAYCRRALLPEEVEHYGVTCERCEGHLFVLGDGQPGLRERYWYYRCYVGCGPLTSAVMAVIGAAWSGS